MTSYPKVSVISALYRKGYYIKSFVENAIEQTYLPNLEFVIDHNEPRGEEQKIIKKIMDSGNINIRYIVTPKVVPLGVSWNKCITESTGEYCAIWNWDDLRCSDSIEKQVQIFMNDTDVQAVGGDYTIVNTYPSTDGELMKHGQYRDSEFSREYLLGPFVMFKKKICERIGLFDEQFLCANDFDFALRIALTGKIGMVRSNLGYFLDEGRGASTNPNSVCPIEATAIRLRYGVYDRIDYRLLKKALKYNIYSIKNGDEWIPLDSIIKNYDEFLEDRLNLWFDKGIRANYLHKEIEWKDKIVTTISRIIHRQ